MSNKRTVDFFRGLVKDKFFTVEFTKKDGTTRKLNGRLEVKKHLKGGELAYSPNDLGYVIVYDMQKKGYRTVDLDKVTKLVVGGVTYSFDA